MSRQIIYWLEDFDGKQVGPSSASRQIIENAQTELYAVGIETTIKMEYFR